MDNLIRILGGSVSHLKKLLQRGHRHELGNTGSRKKVDMKLKIVFPEVSAFIELCRWLWEQMTVGETI